MGTPHNRAEYGQIAKTVLMPGDPLRAKYIAENYLEKAVLVTDVRNAYGYTGFYDGIPVTVMASGMGMPSIGIYSYELFKVYDVERIIRVGSAGAYSDQLKLYDVVLAESAWSESTFAKTQNGCEDSVLYPDRGLNRRILRVAETLSIPVKSAKIHSTDVFYTEPSVDGYQEILEKHGCECVEMESFALFHNACLFGKQAACLLTISDCFSSGKKATVKERETAFSDMITLSLGVVKDLSFNSNR